MKLASLLVVLTVLFAGLTFAQDKPKDQPAPSAAQGMPSFKPAPEMEKLTKMFGGRWKTKETFEKSEMMPGGGSGEGEEVAHSGPGNLSLMSHYKSQGPMGAFEGHGTTWFDPADKKYHSFWCDNMSATGCQLMGTGTWEGDNLVFTGESEMNGMTFTQKMVYSDIKPGSFKWAMQMGPKGGDLKPFMTTIYTKTGEAEHMH
jgi:hypothetical protein